MYKPDKHAENFLREWLIPINGVQPIKFDDALSLFFFFRSLALSFDHVYRRGRRDEQKKRKRKATMKWMKKNGKTE